MSASTRRSRLKIASLFAVLGAAAYLGFTFWRVQRLLAQSRQIAAQSAHFSRDYFVGQGPKLLFVAMGDSTAAGWGAENLDSTYPHQIAKALAARGFRVHVLNIARGGATIAQVRSQQLPLLRNARPDLISLSVGANDATHRTPGADFEREMQLLQADLTASGARTLLLANVPDMFLAPALPLPLALLSGKRARALNARLDTLPANPKTRRVDLFGAGKLNFRRDPGLYAADLFHPSGRGYSIWARLFVQQLDAGGFRGAGAGPNAGGARQGR